MDKSKLINEVIEAVEGKFYLEIGYGIGHNFNQIQAEHKLSVDPEGKAGFKGTSDEFFAQNKQDFDVIFIDGLHHADQVRKDIYEALKLNPKAVILHDTIPQSEEMQRVPREQRVWTGDAWKAAVGFIQAYPEVEVETYRADYGLTVIYPEGFKATTKHFEKVETSYAEFKENEVDLLNIID